ncbi:Na+/H+ antiporter NhaC [Streptomyces cacaoi]|uniref:Na+/H+ antiporter NhaC n=1 Tax=Streptomyces cacaoi TaxID=1898 RepID=UPI001CA8FE13|nr:Na+/H+ antiporter NhaC [Streptomyces cacaoi]
MSPRRVRADAAPEKAQKAQQGKQPGQGKQAGGAAGPRRPSPAVALLPVVTMFVLLGVGNIALDLPSEPMILASAVVAGLVAVRLGHSYEAITNAIAQKFAKVTPAVLILICVGLMMGTWTAGGTIPMLTFYGLKIVSPQMLPLTALIVSAVVSLCTGTSWGSVGTIGVAFMGVAAGLDANLGMVAGAVVAGAYFGDKLSPLSDTTNLAAMATGVNLYTHIGHVLYTTVPSFLATGGVMTVAGLSTDVSPDASPQRLRELTDALGGAYDFNPLLLLPGAIVLAGSLLRRPSIPVMLLSSLVAMVNALVFQGISLADTITSAVSGFKTTMLTAPGFDADSVPDSIVSLLDRGGMQSMMNTLLIAFCAIAFAGIMSLTGSLDVLVERMLRLARTTGRLILTTIATGLLTIGVTSNGQISILMPGETLRGVYVKRGLHPKNLGRTIEDSASVVEPILPWTAAGAYMAGTLGVATLDYLPWAVLCWSGIVFAVLWGFTGFGIARLGPEEQRAMEAEEGVGGAGPGSSGTEASGGPEVSGGPGASGGPAGNGPAGAETSRDGASDGDEAARERASAGAAPAASAASSASPASPVSSSPSAPSAPTAD